MRRLGIPVRRVLTDNGPEYIARPFQDHLADISISHVRIPPRSPNHNAVCERFQGTMLQECWRPAFHRRHFTSIRQLQVEANAWLIRYNTRRRNHGDYMAGRRPLDILNNHTTKQAACPQVPLRPHRSSVTQSRPETWRDHQIPARRALLQAGLCASMRNRLDVVSNAPVFLICS